MTNAERTYLENYDPQAFDCPAVTVDLVLMSVIDGTLHALLMRRGNQPAKGKWALPGGFVGTAESLDEAAQRVLKSKSKLVNAYLEQLYTFGECKRDPRMRVITVAYFSLLPPGRFEQALKFSGELSLARITTTWQGEDGGPAEAFAADGARLDLAFDHAKILGLAVKRLRGKLDYSGVGVELLPPRFTLRQLQEVHEAVHGVRFNKPAFRRRMLDKGELEATGLHEAGVTFRPAELYRFSKKNRRH